jgi:hypothetical protein
MIAPKEPRGIKQGMPVMHEFIMSQLEQIIENDADSDVAEACFCKVMTSLHERKDVKEVYLQYYERLYEIALHAREQHDTYDGKRRNG